MSKAKTFIKDIDDIRLEVNKKKVLKYYANLTVTDKRVPKDIVA